MLYFRNFLLIVAWLLGFTIFAAPNVAQEIEELTETAMFSGESISGGDQAFADAHLEMASAIIEALQQTVVTEWERILAEQAELEAKKQAAQKKAANLVALKQRIYTEYPELLDKTLDDYSRVTLLRQWAWSHVRHAATVTNAIDNDPQIDWWQLDAAEMFQLFEEDRGGVFCGGTALALQRLYEAFGYPAWTINNGDTTIPVSHVDTLVKIQFEGVDLICVQDAYFNTTFVEAATDKPLDYFDLLKRLAGGRYRSIKRVVSDYHKLPSCSAFIIAAKDAEGQDPHNIAEASFSVLQNDYKLEILPDGSLKFVSPRTFQKFFSMYCTPYSKNPALLGTWLLKQGHPVDSVSLYLYPLGFSGPDPNVMMLDAKAIITSFFPLATHDEPLQRCRGWTGRNRGLGLRHGGGIRSRRFASHRRAAPRSTPSLIASM